MKKYNFQIDLTLDEKTETRGRKQDGPSAASAFLENVYPQILTDNKWHRFVTNSVDYAAIRSTIAKGDFCETYKVEFWQKFKGKLASGQAFGDVMVRYIG